MSYGLLLFLLSMFMTTQTQSNGWQGITPLQSTCEDVKKLLKVEKCTLPISWYTLPDFRVMVAFQNETCDSEPRAWRVPRGTVIALTVSPRNEMQPSEFGIDISKYTKREGADVIGVEYYDNKQEGVTVNLYRGFVQDLYLYARKSDAALRCKPPK